MIKEFSSIYIHIPFCEQKCFFCSFVVCVSKKHRIDEYLKSLSLEMKKYKGQKISTIYIGGGTPSVLNEEEIKELFRIIKNNFFIQKKCEITFEVNPDSMSFKKAKVLKALGVNRISIGAQTFSKKYLEFLGRTHKSSDIKKCMSTMRSAGFININLDFMYGFPGQILQEVRRDLKKMINLKSDHLSLYTLSIEPNSKFYRKGMLLPLESTMEKFYLSTCEVLDQNGFDQYEISNFSQEGKESKHNCVYWQGGDYVGFGIGAHSHLKGRRFWNISKLYEYITKIKDGQSSIEDKEYLKIDDRMIEQLLFGLRMNAGVNLGSLKKRFGKEIPGKKRNLINQFIDDGFLEVRRGFLKATKTGRLILDELSARLI